MPGCWMPTPPTNPAAPARGLTGIWRLKHGSVAGRFSWLVGSRPKMWERLYDACARTVLMFPVALKYHQGGRITRKFALLSKRRRLLDNVTVSVGVVL